MKLSLFVTSALPVLALGLAASGQSAAPNATASGQDPFSLVAPARATAEATRVQLDNARADLSDYLRNERLMFESTAEYQDAVTAQQAAHAAFDAARGVTLESLELEPTVAEARKLRQDLTDQINFEKNRPIPDREKLEGLLALRLSISQKLSAREAEALAYDSRVMQARQDLTAATNRLAALNRQYDLRVRTGSSLADQRRTIRQATTSFVYASSLANESAKTANILLDYAYYTQWLAAHRPYIISSPVLSSYGFSPFYGQAGSTVTVPGSNAPVQGTSGAGFGLLPGN